MPGPLSSLFDRPDTGYNPPSALEDLFEHEPVGLRTFIQDRKFLGAEWMLSPKQEELVMVGERIYLQNLYPLLANEFGGYWEDVRNMPMRNSIVAQWGKGGGKDSTVRVISARVAYLLLCLKSPQAYFGMPPDDSIHMLNIAVNAPQAHRAFFAPLAKMVTRGWMKDYADPKRDSIVYAKNLEAISGHSDAEAQEGLNIILGVADEIDAFKAKGEMVGQGNRAREASTSAESILEMIASSASSRFDESWKRIAISYPRYQGSTIQLLTTEAKADIEEHGDDSMFFASGPWATWEVNPTKTKDSFAKQYRQNPDEAAAKYECKPTRATDAYFRNPVIFRHAVDREAQPIGVDYEIVSWPDMQREDVRVTGWEAKFTFAPDFKVIPGARYAIHADLAITGDRAGVAMSHIEKWEERELVKTDETGFVTKLMHTVPVLRNDFTISFTADLSARDYADNPMPREIQIRWVRDLVYELIRRDFYIGSVTYDGFQSVDSMQTLERHGIITDKLSTDRDPSIWKTVKDVASELRVHQPWEELLQKELEGLSRMANGKVDHPPNGSKDLADAYACSLVGAILLGGEEDTREAFAEGGQEQFITGGVSDSMFGVGYDGFTSGPVELPFGMSRALKSGGGGFFGGN